jgi:hypothetical protein
LFAGNALKRKDFVAVWERLPVVTNVPELTRNLPIRQPLLWVDPALANRP